MAVLTRFRPVAGQRPQRTFYGPFVAAEYRVLKNYSALRAYRERVAPYPVTILKPQCTQVNQEEAYTVASSSDQFPFLALSRSALCRRFLNIDPIRSKIVGLIISRSAAFGSN